ncbi:MAG TPA: aldose 1-epimerase family protein [Bacteroidia bacterium]|jgi:galactose mutarotase-like enzyme|nr:aldose 1-epimerase family protein [Bacteroidia bacterium]
MSVYSISNNSISISVNTSGAELISLKSNNNELLWQADKSVWPRYAPVLFPIVGKVKNNQITINNITYNLPQHGFARDKEFVLVEEKDNCLEFELTADEQTLAIYPFHFSLRIRYELEAIGIKIKYIVFNPAGEILPFSIGAHPGFNCKRVADESLEDFYLEFENKKELVGEKLNDGLLSGESYSIKLNENKLPLNPDLFNNDALVFKNRQIEKVKLCSTKSKTQIIFNCKNWPYFGIWSKKGSDSFVCLEPWHGITDSLNAKGDFNNKEGIIKLEAYKAFETAYSFEIHQIF